MIELIVGTYGVACWLVFKKFKLIPVNTYTIFSAFLGGGIKHRVRVAIAAEKALEPDEVRCARISDQH